MKFRCALVSPDEMQMTMTITMNVAQWKQLKAVIKDQYPGWHFAAAIGSIIEKAEGCVLSETPFDVERM